MSDNSDLPDEINKLIKTDGEIENILISQLESLEKLRKIDLSLSYSGWSTTGFLRDITKKNEYLSEKMKKTTESYNCYSKKIKLIKSNRSQSIKLTWQRFMKDSQYYQHLIMSAQEKYKPDNLILDIHRNEIIFEELGLQSRNISRYMEELTVQHGLNELETNIKAKYLKEIQLFIDSLKKDQLSMSILMRNNENKKNNIIQKIKQKENDIKYLISKRR